MVRKSASDRLRHFFVQELQADPNATLETARFRLATICDTAPDDEAVAEPQDWLVETEDLINIHGEHCPLEDFVH